MALVVKCLVHHIVLHLDESIDALQREGETDFFCFRKRFERARVGVD